MTTDNAQEVKVQAYLIYVVLDTSESMRQPQNGSAPLDHFIRLIPQMLRELANHPVTNKLASVSVVAFNDDPEVLRPMTPLSQATPIAPPVLGFGTDYAKVLKFLVARQIKDVRSVKLSRVQDGYAVDVARPWIFFITDGRPFADEKNQEMSEWSDHHERLTQPPIGARIVAIGLPGADEVTLWHMATGTDTGTRNAFISDENSNPRELSVSVVDAIKSSISSSTGTGRLAIKTPVGMHRIDGPRHA